jgi:hypothetical protein
VEQKRASQNKRHPPLLAGALSGCLANSYSHLCLSTLLCVCVWILFKKTKKRPDKIFGTTFDKSISIKILLAMQK